MKTGSTKRACQAHSCYRPKHAQSRWIDVDCRLRALLDYERVPILVLTTESSDAMKAQGKAAGATGWIVKPFDPEKLLHVVKQVLG